MAKKAAKKTSKKSTSTFSPGKGKTWSDKIQTFMAHEVKVNEKGFADIPPGSTMLITTPALVDEYIKQIPKGKQVSLQTMRKDLASEFDADYACPVMTGISMRIVAEAAYEQREKGKAIKSITPFWRVIDENTTIGKKLSFGDEFLKAQRKREKLEAFLKEKKKKK